MSRVLKGILLLGLLQLHFACEKPQLSLGNYTPSLVVISNFTPSNGIQVQVSKSRSPLDSGPTEYINNARVEIWESGKLLEVLHLDDTRNVQTPSYYSEFLRPQIGVDYTIKVSAKGFPSVTATSRIPETVSLDSVKIEKLKAIQDDPGFVRYEFELSIYFTDPSLERNFYHVNVFQKNVLSPKDGAEQIDKVSKLVFGSEINNNYIVANYDGGFLIEDKPINGNAVRIPVKISIVLPAHVKTLDEMIVELRSVSEEYYLFHSTVSLQRENQSLPFSDPVVLFNNIQNGQGVFAGYSLAEKAIKVQPL